MNIINLINPAFIDCWLKRRFWLSLFVIIIFLNPVLAWLAEFVLSPVKVRCRFPRKKIKFPFVKYEEINRPCESIAEGVSLMNGNTIGFHLQMQKLELYILNKQYHVKVLLKGFHLNGNTKGFHPQTQKLELHTK